MVLEAFDMKSGLQLSFSLLWRILIGEEKNQAFLTRPMPKEIMGGKDEKECAVIVLFLKVSKE